MSIKWTVCPQDHSAFVSIKKKNLYGIHSESETHKWISNFLVGRNQSVIVDGSRSEERQVKSGVPQGTVLGPLLFLLHINDITATIDPQTKCRLFADDCLLYRAIKSVQDQVQLQRDLRTLERWATVIWKGTHLTRSCDIAIARLGTIIQIQIDKIFREHLYSLEINI